MTEIKLTNQIQDAGLNSNRNCGTCSACCTYLGVNSLKKHAGQSCQHIKNGDPTKRCGIYETRPEACSGYQCAWRVGMFPDDYRPNDSGMIISCYPPNIFVIQLFDKRKAGTIQTGKLGQVLQRLLSGDLDLDIRVADYQSHESMHFVNGEIWEGRTLKQKPNDYESLAFTHDRNIGRYEIKQQEPTNDQV
jgi:Fe-S-cluster containining protein